MRNPSSRFRVRQYIPVLKDSGIEVTEFISKSNTYPPRCKIARPIWGLCNLAEHFVTSGFSYSYQATWLQREFLSSFYTLEGLTKSPRILDVDDAIWIHSKMGSTRKLVTSSQAIICGNKYIANYFSKWHKNIRVIPTAINLSRFRIAKMRKSPVIVWSGSRSNLKYLYEIEDSLKRIFDIHKAFKLRVIADEEPLFRNLKEQNIEFIPWSPENEIKYLWDAAIGIMPLDDSEWTMGKCSFKMLTYMAACLPVVVSNVGMNTEILQMGNIGIGIKNNEEWIEAINYLINEDEKASQMGINGRIIVERNFTTEQISQAIAEIILEVL